MIKPYSTIYAEEIRSIIVAHGFEITQETHLRLKEERAAEFYQEHEGKSFYPGLVSKGSSLRA